MWVLLVVFEARSDTTHIATVSTELEGKCRGTVTHSLLRKTTGCQEDGRAAAQGLAATKVALAGGRCF